MPDFDPHLWFKDDELEPCPACGEQAAVRLLASGSLLCLGCGDLRAVEVAVEEAQAQGLPGEPV
jgi:hypothetical protein